MIGAYDTDENTLTSSFYGHIAIGYAVEILKENPSSMEAGQIIELINRTLNDDKTIEYYNKLREIHMPKMDDPDFEPAEKIIFLRGLSCGLVANSFEECKQNQLLSNKGLINMKDNCKNQDYAALATIGLFNIRNYDERLKYRKFFLEKFPQHKYVPIVELSIINQLYCENEPQKCIEELLKLSEKYKDYVTPHGWRFINDIYCEVAYRYKALNDYENAQKYYYMIEKEAPNHWNLKYLKKRLFK